MTQFILDLIVRPIIELLFTETIREVVSRMISVGVRRLQQMRRWFGTAQNFSKIIFICALPLAIFTNNPAVFVLLTGMALALPYLDRMDKDENSAGMVLLIILPAWFLSEWISWASLGAQSIAVNNPKA